MVRTFILILCLCPLLSRGQENIGRSREEVKKELEAWKQSHAGYYPKISELPTTSTLGFKDPGYGQVKIVYTYDKSKTCISEKTIAMTDSARNNYLNNILEKKQYEWVKLNGNQYISKFSEKLMVELPGDPKNHSVTVYRVDWTQDIYDLLLKK